MDQFKIDIVVDHMYNYEALGRCLKSLNDQDIQLTGKVIISTCLCDLELEKEVVEANLPDLDYVILNSPIHLHSPISYNLTIKYVNTDLMCNIDGDTIFPPGMFREVKQIFEAHPNGRIVVGADRMEGKPDGTYYLPPPPPPRDWAYGRWFCGSFMVYKKDLYVDMGGFNPFFISNGGYLDADLLTRMRKRGIEQIWTTNVYHHPHHGLRATLPLLLANEEIARKSTFDGINWRVDDKVWNLESISNIYDVLQVIYKNG